MTLMAQMTVIFRGEERLVGSTSCWRSGEKCFGTGISEIDVLIDVRDRGSQSWKFHTTKKPIGQIQTFIYFFFFFAISGLDPSETHLLQMWLKFQSLFC